MQDGPRVAAVIIYLCTGQFLSGKRTAQALAELSGIPLSPGTVAGITARAAQMPDGFPERVRENSTASDVAGFDETGSPVQGRLHGVHCARTGKYTLLTAHPRRGRQAMEAMGVLPSFTGIAVHDARAPYDTYAPAGHQPCCGHAVRELQAVTDSAPAGRRCRAAQAADALTGMPALVSQATGQGHQAADPAALAVQIHRYHSAVLLGARQTAARSGTLMRKHHAPVRRLPGRQDDYPRFTTGWRIPADNNGSERDIRMTKLKTENIRMPAHLRRCRAVLRRPHLPVDRRQARPAVSSARSSCSPHAGPGCQLQRNHARITGT